VLALGVVRPGWDFLGRFCAGIWDGIFVFLGRDVYISLMYIHLLNQRRVGFVGIAIHTPTFGKRRNSSNLWRLVDVGNDGRADGS
jgi:hypothetical protein